VYDSLMGSNVPSVKEGLILALLAERGSLYGLELVTLSEKRLKRGTVYVTLSRMQNKGLVRTLEDRNPEQHAGLPRPKYRITAVGERALLALQTIEGLLSPVRRPA
jgi:DNA-binding PadR family transcriptional regulator